MFIDCNEIENYNETLNRRHNKVGNTRYTTMIKLLTNDTDRFSGLLLQK